LLARGQGETISLKETFEEPAVLDQPAPQSSVRTSGPLAGYRIVEFAGIGPGPFACMMLADMGAEVVTLDRVGARKNLKSVAGRGRKVVEIDLKDKAAVAQVLDLLANADALIEGFRPGVMERLGLGPDIVLQRNPRLVYGRMTGWGQDGPLAQAAGHDINYISVTGALAAIGTTEKPVPPLNLVGDFGGGALYLVVGVLAALLEASRSGKGQVVDTAMCDGAASLMSMFFDMTAAAGSRGASGISWTAARISMASMNVPAAISSRSVRSSRNFMRCCASMRASRMRISMPRWTARRGRP
jgi:alpha-methylacyl-CoA racemase